MNEKQYHNKIDELLEKLKRRNACYRWKTKAQLLRQLRVETWKQIEKKQI